MALEIERRFLVSGERWRCHATWSARLQQGYLMAAADGLTVRVRRAGEQAWLTIKARLDPHLDPAAGDNGMTRQEFEYPIPRADAERLLALAPRQLSKWRHGLDLPGGDWVLDEFEGANAPLVVAEVELADPDQRLDPPAWCVLELTGRHELSNAALAQNPLSDWPDWRRQALLAALEPEPGGSRSSGSGISPEPARSTGPDPRSSS